MQETFSQGFLVCSARVCGSLMVAYSPDENIHKVAMVMCI